MVSLTTSCTPWMLLSQFFFLFSSVFYNMLCNVCENAAVVQPLFTSLFGGISINQPSNQSNDSLYQYLHRTTAQSLVFDGGRGVATPYPVLTVSAVVL